MSGHWSQLFEIDLYWLECKVILAPKWLNDFLTYRGSIKLCHCDPNKKKSRGKILKQRHFLSAVIRSKQVQGTMTQFFSLGSVHSIKLGEKWENYISFQVSVKMKQQPVCRNCIPATVCFTLLMCTSKWCCICVCVTVYGHSSIFISLFSWELLNLLDGKVYIKCAIPFKHGDAFLNEQLFSMLV